jgi:hypothetical protein
MIVNLSDDASDTMLDALATLMNGGRIELLSDKAVLAVLELSDPAAMMAAGGEIEFNDIKEEDAALTQGNAVSARIVGADGSEILTCDVGDETTDAVVKLNTTRIYRNAPVRLRSFKLLMPKGG